MTIAWAQITVAFFTGFTMCLLTVALILNRGRGKVMSFGKSKAQSMIPEEERRIVITGRGGWAAGGVCEHEYMRGTRPARPLRRMPNGTMA